MIDKTILGCIMFSFECTEQCFLGTKNLDCTRWMFREVQQATGVANQPRADELTNEGGEIRCDSIHAVAKVFGELSTVGGNGDYLVTEGMNVRDI